MNTRHRLYMFLWVVLLLVPPAGADQSDEQIKAALSLESFERLELDLVQIHMGQPFSIEVKIEGREYTVNLLPKSVRSPEFHLWISGPGGVLDEAQALPSKTYRGHVLGMPESLVAASLVHGKLHTMIVLDPLDSIAWFIQPLSDAFPRSRKSSHIIYSSWDSTLREHFTDIDLPKPTEAGEPQEGVVEGGFPLSPPQGNFYLTEIAVDADWEFYSQNNASVPDTVDDIESILNAVTLIYERDAKITWEVTEIVVRTEEGVPYPTNLTHPGHLIEGFRFWWNKHHQSYHRDVAHLVTGKHLDGNVIGIGWDRVICESLIDGYGYALSRSRFHANYNYRITVTTHEIAHNYGVTGHCDNEPECYIMCSYLGACDGIGLPNFSPWSVGKITQYADAINCLDLVSDDAIAVVAVDANVGMDELAVEVTPADRNGQTSGLVPFTRSYFDNTSITLTAPLEFYVFWMLWRFQKWELDGVAQPLGEDVLELTTQAWESMDAFARYKRANVLPITSTPVHGVEITLAPPDLDGESGGSTPFEVTYFLGDEFTVTAPLKKGDYAFRRWVVHGVKQPLGQNMVNVTMPTMGAVSAVARYTLEPNPEDPLPGGKISQSKTPSDM